MGPVDENTRTFYLDCYFRQKWMDERLRFNKTDGVEELALNWAFLAKIWVPDTFFVNGKKSYLHKITVRICVSKKFYYSLYHIMQVRLRPLLVFKWTNYRYQMRSYVWPQMDMCLIHNDWQFLLIVQWIWRNFHWTRKAAACRWEVLRIAQKIHCTVGLSPKLFLLIN